MLSYVTWIVLATPAIILVVLAALRTKLDMRGAGLVLVLITCLAPLQIYAIWRWNHGYGVLYALVCYAAALGLAFRLSGHSASDALHWPLIIVLVLTAVVGLAAVPMVTWPRVRSAIYAEKQRSDGEIDVTLKQIDVALSDMQEKQDTLQTSRADLVRGLEELRQHREKLNREIHEAELRKEQAQYQLEHPTPKWVEHFLSFIIGVASSFFYGAAAKFLQRNSI
jgi:hypothetical protein